ncbi:hypothetical protein CA13_14970 [Planctomycetes bacterium CA13]|uniref:Uncharacterized protein n=1 Tax=Novipirellula herctigrandis TaxID=2527986 RepID=A0A5C5YYG1_9BACT|nr:hypothetical protein CA13_14970 [Planctomycetes bacterium CA13]
MWKTNELGHATWVDPVCGDSSHTWWFDARGGERGISIGRDSDSNPLLQFLSVGDDTMPVVEDQFVRGDQWHVSLPQKDHQSYSLHIIFRPIRSSADQLRLEATVSLETLLLDTHPMIDLVSPASKTEGFSPDFAKSDKGCNPICVANSERGKTAILLGPHDFPFTTDQSDADGLRLRLFGEFLEKGVIRKARPWIQLDALGNPQDRDSLIETYRELSDSPLPLTS